ncbi:hypothetical protein IFM89_021523 [Coptis chinensis]|uniref:RRM domain-containing protein n=1 Tax=Coptis chinensis TaxID=261450 RepID=A0A835INZ9_9MAGN|nr:hypothetical protein IFM89_021523 [Coptis chinensis]
MGGGVTYYKNNPNMVDKCPMAIPICKGQFLLQLCGPVKSWKRAQDPSNEAPRGFGFCEFESAEGLLRALRMGSKFKVDGQELVGVDFVLDEDMVADYDERETFFLTLFLALRDKLMAALPSDSSSGGSQQEVGFSRTRNMGKLVFAASLGMIFLWDVDSCLAQIDKYFHSNDNHIIAGALLGVGIVNNDCDPALALLADYIDREDSTIRIGAIMGLGLAYAGSQNEIRKYLWDWDWVLRTPGPRTRVEATAEVSKTFNEKIRKYCDMTLLSCAYARTGNVLKVQNLLGHCAQHLEKDKGQCMDTLSRFSHDSDSDVAMAAIISLGLIGAGTNNARIDGIATSLVITTKKLVRIAQGLLTQITRLTNPGLFDANKMWMDEWKQLYGSD